MQPQTAVVMTTPTSVIASSPTITVNPGGNVDPVNVDTKYSGDWNIWDK